MDTGVTDSIIRQNYNEKVVDGLNKLYNVENDVVYLLDAMAIYFGTCSVARPGLAKAIRYLSKRAKTHCNLLLTHMKERGFPVIFEDIRKPSVESWRTPLTAVVTGLEVLKDLNETWMVVHKLSLKYEDPCTELLVKKILCEHVMLMKILGNHLVNLKRIGDDETGLYMYDLKSFKVIPKVDTVDTDLDTDFDTLIH